MGTRPSKLTPSETSVVSTASFNLFLETFSTDASQGCFMSPLSIMYALSLALNGAGRQSQTHAELLRVFAGHHQELSKSDLNSVLSGIMRLLLNRQSDDTGKDPSSEMILVNSLWTHRGLQLKRKYVDSMQSLFQATAREATNGARDINAWVEEATRGLIQNLIENDKFDAVLANAIYFKGLWQHAFDPQQTKPRNFTTLSGETKEVSMMQQLFEPPSKMIKMVRSDQYDALSLPYKGGAFSAVALLPTKGVEMSAALKHWAASPQAFSPMGRVRVTMPKFKVASAMSMVPVLKGLGVQAAFQPSADFSRMVNGGLFISDVVHKAVVEVDEEGTVAAAASAVLMMACVPPPPEEIVFDRPFAFMIYHNPTGLPAFIGVIGDPTAA